MARVTLKLGGVGVLFRVPIDLDGWHAYRRPPLLPIREPGRLFSGDDDKAKALDARIDAVAMADVILSRCAIAPQVVVGCPAELPQGALALDEISGVERAEVAGELYRLAGFTKEAAADLDPLPETRPDS